MLRPLFALAVVLAIAMPSAARSAQPSQCLAIAQNLPRVQYAALQENEASLTYIGHSTFLIESPQGIRVATDYSGDAGGVIPDAVTMNHAHSTHFTEFPDPAIKHVLKGWGEEGKPAVHDVTLGDIRIRNVTTDIRLGAASRVKDGNSIFVFEVAGLCIGHLGHLHHELTPRHMGWIGRLDVVMVPVDGGLTMPVENMMQVLRDIKARIVIPMHFFRAGSLERFVSMASSDFKFEYRTEPQFIVSLDKLPSRPTVYVLPGRQSQAFDCSSVMLLPQMMVATRWPLNAWPCANKAATPAAPEGSVTRPALSNVSCMAEMMD
jgi:L-ascorbate metabolism protein UlaG (beta-lactamase superfamily)